MALDYGDGSLLVEGDAHELVRTLSRAVTAMRASQGMDSEYSDGYRAARSFYGDDDRRARQARLAAFAPAPGP